MERMIDGQLKVSSNFLAVSQNIDVATQEKERRVITFICHLLYLIFIIFGKKNALTRESSRYEFRSTYNSEVYNAKSMPNYT